VAEVEQPVPVCDGFSHMEVCANQRDKEGVKEPVDELEKYLCPLFYIGFGEFYVVVLTVRA
jgi:hypothetical protein